MIMVVVFLLCGVCRERVCGEGMCDGEWGDGVCLCGNGVCLCSDLCGDGECGDGG